MAIAAAPAKLYVNTGLVFPVSSPPAKPIANRISATKFGRLVRMKKATVRRAMCSAFMPPFDSAHAPSASPPAPPAGSSELAACSAIPIW